MPSAHLNPLTKEIGDVVLKLFRVPASKVAEDIWPFEKSDSLIIQRINEGNGGSLTGNPPAIDAAALLLMMNSYPFHLHMQFDEPLYLSARRIFAGIAGKSLEKPLAELLREAGRSITSGQDNQFSAVDKLYTINDWFNKAASVIKIGDNNDAFIKSIDKFLLSGDTSLLVRYYLLPLIYEGYLKRRVEYRLKLKQWGASRFHDDVHSKMFDYLERTLFTYDFSFGIPFSELLNHQMDNRITDILESLGYFIGRSNGGAHKRERRPHVSLSKPLGYGDSSFGDILPSEGENPLEQTIKRMQLDELRENVIKLAYEHPQEFIVLYLQFFLSSKEEVGHLKKITEEVIKNPETGKGVANFYKSLRWDTVYKALADLRKPPLKGTRRKIDFYLHQRTIAELLGFSASRISQITTNGIALLREQYKKALGQEFHSS